MSLLTYNELVALVDNGVIRGVPRENINGASIDITLGKWVMVEAPAGNNNNVVDLMAREVPAMRGIDLMATGYYDLAPYQFCLASTAETFFLPNDIAAEYRLKSSLARAGLDAALAMWCDPGWHGSVLTLEFKNNLRGHNLRLRPSMKAGQMIFWRGQPVPDHASYAVTGQYNGDTSAQPAKGLR